MHCAQVSFALSEMESLASSRRTCRMKRKRCLRASIVSTVGNGLVVGMAGNGLSLGIDFRRRCMSSLWARTNLWRQASHPDGILAAHPEKEDYPGDLPQFSFGPRIKGQRLSVTVERDSLRARLRPKAQTPGPQAPSFTSTRRLANRASETSSRARLSLKPESWTKIRLSLRWDVFEDLDLYIAYQLQQELDFSNIHDSPPDLEDNDSVGDEQPHWVDSDSDGGDEGGEDIINLARFAYDFDKGVDEEDADRFTHDEEEEVDDDENDQYGRQSPTPSDNSALTFSPDPSARNSPEPLARGSKAHPISLSSSEESLLQSVANPESSSGRVCPAFSCSICLDDHPETMLHSSPPASTLSAEIACAPTSLTKSLSIGTLSSALCTTLADQQSPGSKQSYRCNTCPILR
ncbi:hypothetical protein IMY05_C4820000300 [Salix suchowensis]|nr:hypothetical protein IMY05_C4820000300 [Salix suchowensis]